MTQQEVIKAFMKSFDTTTKKGEAALNEAIKACSTFNSFQELKTAIINDCKNAKSADDFLKTYCGIDLYNDDTGAITGKDAGGATVKTASSIVPEEGYLVEFNKGDWFDNIDGQEGLIVRLGQVNSSNNVVKRSFDDLSRQEKYLWRSIYTWWIRNGLALISESYGNNFSFDKENSSATNKDRTIYIIFEYFEDSDNSLAATRGGPSHNQKSTNNLAIRINLKYHDKATGKDGAVINGQEYLDRTIAHELTHAVMRANIDYFDYLPALIKEGVAELTHGIDDVRTDAIKKLAADSNLLSQALVLDEETIDVSGIHSPTYAGGYMFLRYLARQAGDLTIENSSDSIVRTFRGNDKIKNYSDGVTITSGNGNDLISNDHSNKVTMLGGAGNDTLWNWSTDSTKATGANVSMDGGAGNDTIWNGGNYATIVGGTGNDSIYNGGSYVLFKYSSGDGNDKIYNWSANDTISITGGKYSRSTVGSDVVLTVGSGKITLVGANGKTLNIKGTLDSGNVGATINNTLASKFLTGTSYADSIKNTGSKVTISTATGNDTINNNLGHDTSVNAGAGNDSIYNYSDRTTILGGDGNDTLTNITWKSYINSGAGNDRISLSGGYYYNTVVGGMGDDTIYGDTAPQTFKYAQGDGNDKIYNWSANDTISITGGKYSRSSVGNDVVLTVGTGKITLVGANGKTLNIVGEYDPTRLILTNSSKAAVTLATAYDIGDASSRTKAIKIVGNAKDNSILGGSKNDTLYGKDSDDYIVGNAGDDKLYGQDDDDTLWGGAGNDTLIGGDGYDLFVFSAGKDLIYDYATGDRISLGSAISKATVSGSNVVLTTGNGTLTVKGGKNKKLSLITSTGSALSTIISGFKIETFDNNTASKVTLAANTDIGDATARTKAAIRIVGNALDNSILGGSKNDTLYGKDGDDYLTGNAGSDKLYGQDGDDTLYGGAGNDSLWGGDGDDTFIYNSGDGKDVIYGFDDDDMLEISDKFSAKYYASSDKIVFKVGSTASAITLKDLTADTFNINGDTYKISGSKLVKK